MNEVIEKARGIGADVETGLKRCAGREDLYAMLIGTALKDKNFAILREKVTAKDVEGSFEAAHALKGVLSNLCLYPLADELDEVTEVLRGGQLPDEKDMEAIEREREEYMKIL